MGKSRVKKTKVHRENVNYPLVTTSSVEPVDLEPSNIYGRKTENPSKSIKALSTQLQSSSVEDRDCACIALTNLIRNSTESQLAIHHGLVKILGPLLLDTSPSVCHSASSALCSLISVGGDEIIQQALHQDILTPLIALMKKVPSEWIPNQQASDHIDTSVATFIETVRTLTVLSESSSESVDRLHQEKVVSMLINYLDLTKYGSDLVVTVSRFLSIVTEDQGDTDYVDVLKTKIILLLETPESNLLLKSLGVGILLNLNHQCYNNELGISALELTKVLSSVLQEDHQAAATKIIEQSSISCESDDESNMDTDEKLQQKLDDLVDSVEKVLSSQTVALEILTNLCSCGDEFDEMYEDLSCSESSLIEDGIEDSETQIEPELKKELVDAKLFQMVIDKAKLPPENVITLLKQQRSGELMVKRYETLQSRAFLCMSNLVTCFNIDEMGGVNQLFEIWCSLGVMTFQGVNPDQVIEAATTSMQAILRKLAQHNHDVVSRLRVEDVTNLCQKVATCSQPESKVNFLQIISILGSMAAGSEPPLTDDRAVMIEMIGTVLIDIACIEQNLWVVAEALDAIFEVFKEDYTDGVSVTIKLVERLKTLAPGFKHRVQSQRRSLGSHLPVVMTSKDNLLRFIKYKVKQRATGSL